MFQLSNIKYKINKKVIIDKVTINIPKNKLTVILGPSGSGKSTLLKLISGRISYRNIKINDKNISSNILNYNTAFVYQHHYLPADLTVNEYFHFCYNCKSTSINNKEIQNIIDELLQKLDIFNIKNRKIGEMGCNLSGGQLKRIELGLELLSKPDILFVDEPLSGLDSYSSLITIKHIKNLKETAVITAHNPSNSILEYCDHIIILYNSKIFFEGTSEELTKYINKIGYKTIDSNMNNNCEFVFLKIFPDIKRENKQIENFIYKSSNSSKSILFKDNQISIIKKVFISPWIIFKRLFIEFYRNYKYGLMRLLQSLISVSFVVLIFRNIDSIIPYKRGDNVDDMYRDIINHRYNLAFYQITSYLIFFVMLSSFIQNSMAGCNIFSKNFHLIIKENSNNYYTIPAYYLSVILFEFLTSLILSIVPYIIGLYFIKGDLNNRFKIGVLLGLIPCSLISLSSMMLFSAFFYDNQIPFVVYSIYSIFILATSGIFSDNSHISLTKYIEKINPLRYGTCFAIKYWLVDEAKEKYFLDQSLIYFSYKTFYSLKSLPIRSFIIIGGSLLISFLLFYWKIRSTSK